MVVCNTSSLGSGIAIHNFDSKITILAGGSYSFVLTWINRKEPYEFGLLNSPWLCSEIPWCGEPKGRLIVGRKTLYINSRRSSWIVSPKGRIALLFRLVLLGTNLTPSFSPYFVKLFSHLGCCGSPYLRILAVLSLFKYSAVKNLERIRKEMLYYTTFQQTRSNLLLNSFDLPWNDNCFDRWRGPSKYWAQNQGASLYS